MAAMQMAAEAVARWMRRTDDLTQDRGAMISARILTLVAQGMPLERAIDDLLGVGTYGVLVEELYHELRSPALASSER